jgi:translocation and assembly module TamB
LIISSDLLQLNLEGQYKWQDLPSTLFTFTNQYFPLAQAFLSGRILIRTNALDSTRFQAHFTISDPTPLTQIILPELKTLDTFNLQLSFEGAEDQWKLTAKLPKFHYSDVRLDTLEVHSVANANRFYNQIKASRLDMGANNTFFHPTIKANLGDSTLHWEIKSYENIEEPLWQIGGQVISHEEEWQLLFDTSLLLEAQPWTINPDHTAQFRWGDAWNIDRLQLKQTASSFLQLDGGGSFIDSSSNAFLSFQQFDIDIISPFLDYPPDYLDGILNGKFSVKDFLRKPNFSASLDLQQWSVDSVLIGDLSLNARKVPGRPLIEVASDLGGHGNELNIQGQFDINQQQFSTQSTIQQLNLETLDPFLTGLVHDSRGYLSGNFSAEGKINRPIVKGNLQFNDVTTTIDYVNTPYTFTQGKLSFTEDQINFENISLLDSDGYEATLRGNISHQYFDDIAMDLNFNTDRFRFLNTTAKDNDLFYGRLILASDINIQGPIDNPRFFINAKTQPNTNFYVVPLTDEQAISREDFIIYGQPALDSMGRDTGYLNNYQVKAPGIDLRLNLEMTPDAALEIIMDPLTGDKLICKGRSNLSVGMNPAGEVNISGTYEITEGSYSFSFEQLIQRNFDILPNSKIIFSGDPLQAELDITTSYQVRVPLSDLVESQLTTDTRLSGLRTDVKVLMKISGNIIQPVLDFDIILVGDAQGATVDAAQTRLQQLRSSETELNKQVFGLLLFNSFIKEQGGSQSFVDAGEAVVLSSVSKLVANQLNRLADQYLKGFNFSLGLDSYRPGLDPTEETGVTTEVQLDVSKRLFNDRLNVKVGGNVNVGTDEESQTLSAFSSDFVLEYRLNPTGGTLLRVYRRNDYDALNEGNVIRTGAGISIKKTLENKKRNRKHE